MDASGLVQVLEHQAEQYDKLLRLAELQHDCVRQRRDDELLDILQRRQTVVDQIAAVEQRLRPIKLQWSAVATRLGADQRTRAESALSRSRTLLERITLADQDDAILLQQRKLDVGRELRSTQVKRNATAGYAAGAYRNETSRVNIAR